MQQSPEYFHWTDERGQRIEAVHYPAERPPVVLGFVHGINEHAGRYAHVMEWFGQHGGFACLGYDRQGYGRSGGRPGYAVRYTDYLDEIARLVVACERRYPDTPLVLYGHSMGGHLLLTYLIKRRPDISAAIITAPHLELAFQPNPFLVTVGKLLRGIAPKFTQSNPLELDALSRDPAVAEAFAADPLTHDKISTKTGMDILDNANWLNEWTGTLPVPTLLMHGDADRLTSHAASRAFAARNPEDLTWKSWPGLYHELHNEPEKEEVMAFVLEWLGGRVVPVHRPSQSV